MITFLHIPKTGCTSIKYALADQRRTDICVKPHKGHQTHLSKINKPVGIIVRDPWQRFCSGFWERKTMEQRRRISKSVDAETFGYAEYNNTEKNILASYTTPEKFFLWAHDNQKDYRDLGILHELTDSVTRWLGSIEQFYKHEHKIVICFEIGHLTPIMNKQFDLVMPKDAFRKRSRNLFDFDQTYQISERSLNLFKQWRQADYQLLDYIKKQPYYINY